MLQRLSIEYIKEKWNHAGFQKYFQNMSWMFAARFFVMAIAFFVNAYVARYLGPSNYGLLNYVFSFVGLFAFFSSLGIENIANREIIKNHENKNKIIGTSFYLKLFGGFFALVAVIVAGILTTNDPVLLSLIAMYSFVFIFSTFNIIEVYFQSQVLSKYPAIVTITSGIISAILKLIAIYLGLGIIWLTAIYVIDSIIFSLGLIFFFIHNGHTIREWIFDKAIAIEILKDSWPLMLSSVAWSIYMRIDQVMIKNMLGNEQTGIYAVAAKLSEFWYFIPSGICASLFPAIVNAKKTNTGLYNQRLKKLYSLMFWLSFSVALIITTFAYLIIFLLFGEQYIEAATPLKIYVWAGIAVSIGSVLWYYLIAENRTIVSAAASFVGAISNILLNLLLIPKYGINGAAFASFLSYTMVTIAVILLNKDKTQFRIIKKSIIPKLQK